MSDTATFLHTMMRACWLTAVAYISYNIFVKCTSGDRWPPPDRAECVGAYQDMLCAECMESSQECSGSPQFGDEHDADGTSRDTCCEGCIDAKEEEERKRHIREAQQKRIDDEQKRIELERLEAERLRELNKRPKPVACD